MGFGRRIPSKLGVQAVFAKNLSVIDEGFVVDAGTAYKKKTGVYPGFRSSGLV